MSKTTNFHETVNSVNADEFPLVCVEIEHASLGSTVRIVNDTDDLTHSGDVYTALNFRVKLPNQPETGRVSASLEVDNNAKELVDWIDSSNGANGAQVTFHQVLRSNPNVSEYDVILYATNVQITPDIVSMELSFTDIYNRACLPTTYNRTTAKGLF